MAPKRKPGKYDHLLHKLKPMPAQDLDHQLRVEAMKVTLRRCALCDGSGKVEIDTQLDASHYRECQHCNGMGRRTLTGQSLANQYVIARADVETLTNAIKDANLELEAVSQMLIASQESGDADWGAFGASDRALKMMNGDSVRLQPEVYPVAQKKDEFRNWCYDHKLHHKMELPIKTMTDLVKLRLLNGESEPTGVNVYVRTKVVYTPLKTEVTTPNEQADVDVDIF